MIRRYPYLLLGGLACIAAGGIVVSAQVASLDATIRAFARIEDASMQTLTEEVARTDGRKATVTTTRKESESVADFIARHDAVVQALKTTP